MRPPEAKRDQVESAFTPILRRLWDAVPNVLAAVFVDTEGECIDYVSSIEPFDAKVSAAHMLMIMDTLERGRDKVGAGDPTQFEITATEREVWALRVGEDYLLVLVLLPGVDRNHLKSAVSLASNDFRNEVGIAPPRWEGSGKRLSVRVRGSAAGWRYAPSGFSDGSLRVVIADVLGRWTEQDDRSGEELVCFRVRTADGQELTLVHDPAGDGWLVRE